MLLAVIATAVAAKEWIAPLFSRPYTSATKAKFVSSDNLSARHLIATMWVESVRIYSDTDVRVDLDLENHSGRTAEPLSIHLEAPGFEETGPCWQDHHPACLAADGQSRVAMPATLEAGKSIHLYATLKSLSAGSFGILAIYQWAETGAGGDNIAKGGAPETYTRAVSLDPIEVTTRWLDVLARFGELLAVPVLLALAGPLWQWIMKRHDERYKEREQQRQRQENEREKAFQVWKEQLARVFEYTQQHYLHITRSVRGLQAAVAKTRAGEYRSRERVFYHFMMFWMHMRNLSVKKGGFFLMTLDAENVLSDASYLLWNQFEAKLNDKRLDNVASRLKPPVSLAKFRQGWNVDETAKDLINAEAEYLAWMNGGLPYGDSGDSFNGCLGLMNLMRIVLRFEWNRPFVEYWYLKKPNFELDEMQEVLRKLLAAPQGNLPEWKGLVEKASQYADSVQTYLKAVGY